MHKKIFLYILISILSLSLQSQVITGAERIGKYLPTLQNKRVGLTVNHTSLVNKVHLVDTLNTLGINITAIFAPEHGFRGNADAGETVSASTDSKTGIHIYSLYGKNKKPLPQQMSEIDIMLFDIQDVGVRFYTYISTLQYVMEACAENNIPLIILDRPNPNGDYFDGPILDTTYKSFVGMHPIPVVHGLTIGELAQMIKGEKWIGETHQINLTVITCDNYTHNTIYQPPIPPSPNLPNYKSIRLFPSLCLFEATKFSIGRGTLFPFQVIGYPDSKYGSFQFTPVSIEGMSKNPPQKDKLCYGIDLRNINDDSRFTLKYFLDFYKLSGNSTDFISDKRWLNLLAGTDILEKQIISKATEKEIRKSWEKDLEHYKNMRAKYLLYQ